MLVRTFNKVREALDEFLWTDANGNRRSMRFGDKDIPVLRRGLLFVSYTLLKRLMALIVLPVINGFTLFIACGLCLALFPAFRDFAKSIIVTAVSDFFLSVLGIISNAILPLDTFLLRMFAVAPLFIPGVAQLFPTLMPNILSLLNILTYSNMSFLRMNLYMMTTPIIYNAVSKVGRRLSVLNDVLLFLPRKFNKYIENKLLQQDVFLNKKIVNKDAKLNVLDNIMNAQRILGTGVVAAYVLTYVVPALMLATPIFAVPIGLASIGVSWYFLSRWRSQQISNFKAIFSWADLIAKETSAVDKEVQVIEYLQQLKADNKFTFGGIASQHALEQFLTVLKLNIPERIYGKMTIERMNEIEDMAAEHVDQSSFDLYRVPVLTEVIKIIQVQKLDFFGRPKLDHKGDLVYENLLDSNGEPVCEKVLDSDGQPQYERNDLFSLLKAIENSSDRSSPKSRTPVFDITKQIKFDKQMYTFIRRKVYVNQPERIALWEAAEQTGDYSNVIAMLKAAPKLYDPSQGLLDPCIELAAALEKYNSNVELEPTADTTKSVCPILGKIIEHPVVVDGKCYELLGVLNALTTSDKLSAVDKTAAPEIQITLDAISFGSSVDARQAALRAITIRQVNAAHYGPPILMSPIAQQQNDRGQDQRTSYFARFRLPTISSIFSRVNNAPSPNGNV